MRARPPCRSTEGHSRTGSFRNAAVRAQRFKPSIRPLQITNLDVFNFQGGLPDLTSRLLPEKLGCGPAFGFGWLEAMIHLSV